MKSGVAKQDTLSKIPGGFAFALPRLSSRQQKIQVIIAVDALITGLLVSIQPGSRYFAGFFAPFEFETG